MDISTNYYYTVENHYVCTLAFYGNDAPDFFHGNLRLRSIYSDEKKTNLNVDKTQEYIVDEIYYQVNKIVRQIREETYDEPRELATVDLQDNYVAVYNKNAAYSTHRDNHNALLKEKAPNALGTAIILKKNNNRLTWLMEDEAKRLLRNYEARNEKTAS